MWRFLKKQEIDLPYDPAMPLLGIHTKETRIERDTCASMFIAALFTIGRIWKQPRCPSADEWIRKLYKYTMECYSAIKKNAFESVVLRWIKLEPIIQSEVNQKDKHQYSTLTCIYWIYKDGNDDLICKMTKETDVKTEFWTLWKKARVGWFEKIALKMYITTYKIDDQSKFSAWNRALKAGTLRQSRGMGWGGRWQRVMGRGDTCTPMTDSCQWMAKTTAILQSSSFSIKINKLIILKKKMYCSWESNSAEVSTPSIY